MATIKSNVPDPIPTTYSILLSEQEAQGLCILLNGGVDSSTLNDLLLTDLLYKLANIKSLMSDGCADKFQNIALLKPKVNWTK